MFALCFLRIMASRFADTSSVEQFIKDQVNKNTRKVTQQNVSLVKEFLMLRTCRRNSPKGAECIHC